jgi:hypothetical protein
MQKAIEVYTKISCVISIAAIGYLMPAGNRFIILYISLVFTAFNGVLMLGAGIYLLLKKNKILGALTLLLSIIFYALVFYSFPRMV